MSKLAKVVQDFVDQMDWHESLSSKEDGSVQVIVKLDIAHQQCQTYIETREEYRWFLVVIYCPFAMDPENAAETCILLNHINNRMRCGTLYVDMDSNRIAYRALVDIEGCEPHWKVLDNMLRSGYQLINRWMSAFAMVAVGSISATKAIAALDAPKSAQKSDDLESPTTEDGRSLLQ